MTSRPFIAGPTLQRGSTYTGTSSCWVPRASARRTFRLRSASRRPRPATHLLHHRGGPGPVAPGRSLEETVLYKLLTYLSPSVLVVDELGYLPTKPRRTGSSRWRADALTGRRSSWPQTAASLTGVFADPVVAAAIVDRLLGNATVVNIRGRSYRMQSYQGKPAAKGAAIIG